MPPGKAADWLDKIKLWLAHEQVEASIEIDPARDSQPGDILKQIDDLD